MRLDFQAVVPTFNRRRPISEDGKGFAFTQDCPGRRNLRTRNDRFVRANSFRYVPRGLGRFKLRPRRYHTVLHVTPQRHQQPPGHRHDADAAHAFAAAGEALPEP